MPYGTDYTDERGEPLDRPVAAVDRPTPPDLPDLSDPDLWAATMAEEAISAPPDVPEPIAVDEFWTARPVLEHIHTFARARRASPWAVLGVVLARVVVAVKPFAVLPPLVGGEMSLNLFVGIVGPSGAGKGAAESAAADAIDLGTIETWNVGSGEGIAHLFMHRETVRGEGKVLIQHAEQVLMSAAEIDTITALSERRGATLLAELRKAWVGERLGFAYADPEKRLPVEAHAYRLGLVAGIQPAKAAGLLDDSDGGTPQRFIWLPATDPDAPATPPALPDRWEWKPPHWPVADHRTRHAQLPVCETARLAIDTARVAGLRGEGDPLDGHALLARLKTAAAMALLDIRSDVTEEDWALAGIIQAVSDRTRSGVVATLQDGAASANRRRGEAEADRAVVVAERVDDHVVKRVARNLTRKLTGRDWVAFGDLRKSISSRDREQAEEALDRLVSSGVVEVENADRDDSGHGGSGQRYRLVGG